MIGVAETFVHASFNEARACNVKSLAEIGHETTVLVEVRAIVNGGCGLPVVARDGGGACDC
jgi:hypothetical protein